MTCTIVATDPAQVRFCLTLHARERLAEMDVTVPEAIECLTSPDQIRKPSTRYPEARVWCRADLSLPAAECGDHLAVITALPRTQEAWHRLYGAGTSAGREIRTDLSFMDTEEQLKWKGLYRPFTPSARILGELREACEYARRAAVEHPNDLKVRSHYDRLRAQFAAAMEKSA